MPSGSKSSVLSVWPQGSPDLSSGSWMSSGPVFRQDWCNINYHSLWLLCKASAQCSSTILGGETEAEPTGGVQC